MIVYDALWWYLTASDTLWQPVPQLWILGYQSSLVGHLNETEEREESDKRFFCLNTDSLDSWYFRVSWVPWLPWMDGLPWLSWYHNCPDSSKYPECLECTDCLYIPDSYNCPGQGIFGQSHPCLKQTGERPWHLTPPLHPLHLMQPLPLQQQPLSLQKGSGAVVPEPCSETNEDDSGGLSPASSHTRSRSRADPHLDWVLTPCYGHAKIYHY